MANPTAPLDSAGAKMGFGIFLTGGNDTPAWARIVDAAAVADETTVSGALVTNPQPSTAGGVSTFMASGSDGSSILVATKQTIKASAGQLYGWHAYNPEAAVTFVHIYNTDTVTVGTTNPQMTIAVPAGGVVTITLPYGIVFTTAMSCAATTTAGGNGAPATGVSLVAWYK